MGLLLPEESRPVCTVSFGVKDEILDRAGVVFERVNNPSVNTMEINPTPRL
ncbi:hypothetical protein [Corynebacterium kroppenstedtii]|uniref:hypothetical protein n=1 Tax=Corynebacterium kroppenstedtii TaxID=161879 RepID=UPI0026ED9E57|nr:hypothetical protein [Corynebacterium kroppenstedtii]